MPVDILFGTLTKYFSRSCGYGAAPRSVRTTDGGAGYGGQLLLGYLDGSGQGDGQLVSHMFSNGSGTGITAPTWTK